MMLLLLLLLMMIIFANNKLTQFFLHNAGADPIRRT